MTDKRFDTNWQRPEIIHNKPTAWNWVVAYPDADIEKGWIGLELGEKTDIGAFTYIQAQHGVEIQARVQIGAHCTIYSISTISSSGDPITGKVVIEEGAQIGAGSVIMPGVRIGKGAIVGAMTFVTKDVPAGATAVGIPARILERK